MQDANRLVEHLFRHQWGQLVAALTRRFGFERLDHIEDAVQEALITALKSWPTRGIPASPEAWLHTVARNRLLDSLRSDSRRGDLISTQDAQDFLLSNSTPTEPAFRGEVADDFLRLILRCCDPEIPPDARVALTLQLACGFSTREIAAAFLSTEDAIAKRIYRAKAVLTANPPSPDNSTADRMPARLDSLLEVIYLLFNEGYSSHGHADLVRYGLCAESLRLARLLTRDSRIANPRVFALAALICIQSARLSSRVGFCHELLLLENQNRSLWDQSLISEGLGYLDKAASGNVISRYHLEAGIAACHAAATSYADTDWIQILFYYDQLLGLFPDDLVRLNRAVAFAKVNGPGAALRELPPETGQVQKYYLYHATVADLKFQIGDRTSAAAHFQRAIELAPSPAERDFLLRRLSECES